MKICATKECGKPHRARGLCAYCWKLAYGKPEIRTVACAACGTPVDKKPSGRRSVCSTLCRRFLQFGTWPTSTLPDTHPVLSTPIPADHSIFWPWLNQSCPIYIPDCGWCGQAFVTPHPDQLYCSRLCTRRRSRATRRGREYGAPGTYTWAEVIALHLKFDRCCAYCRQPIDGQPDPDHVVPLSKGGCNSITNILPSCKACNSDKRDLLLHEWAADRERRGLPKVITTWVRGDLLYVHLSIIQAHEHAA